MRRLLPIACLLSAALAPAQTWVTIPAGFDELPGNAAVSMPGRWSWGTVQVAFHEDLLTDLQGQTITRLRLRRPSFHDEPAYGAVTRTFQISLGPFTPDPAFLSGQRTQNNDDNNPMPVVFGPQSVSIPATPAPSQTDVTGPWFIDVPLTQPFTVPVSGNLLLEWRTLDSSLAIDPLNFVDAVWMQNGEDKGLAVPVGQHGCGGTGTTPMRLTATGNPHPAFGSSSSFRLEGAKAQAPVHMVFGFDPLDMAVPVPFGTDIAVEPFATGCQLWTPLDFVIDAGSTGQQGTYNYSFDFPPTNSLQGMQIGVQALVVEAADPVEDSQIVASNGVVLWMDSIEVGDKVATQMWLQDDDWSSWSPFSGLTPVIQFGY